MEPAINLYSSNEKSELIRENSQEILSVLAAHQIALWEYDIITGKCSFSNDYFFTLHSCANLMIWQTTWERHHVAGNQSSFERAVR